MSAGFAICSAQFSVLGRRMLATLIAAATAVVPVTPPSAMAAAAADRPPFYEPSPTPPPRNGDVIRSEPSAFYLDPLKAVKVSAHVDRIMHRTTDRAGQPIAVTGTVLTPKIAHPKIAHPAPRPIVAFVPGTQGPADKCASPARWPQAPSTKHCPSRPAHQEAPRPGLCRRGDGLSGSGLGTPGTHTYMTREAQGHAPARRRAARSWPPSGQPNGSRARTCPTPDQSPSTATPRAAEQRPPRPNSPRPTSRS